MIDILNKCHTDPRLINNHYLTILFITLKVQDIHYFFSKSISFTFFWIIFFLSALTCGVHVLAIRKQRPSENSEPLEVPRVITFGTLRVQ